MIVVGSKEAKSVIELDDLKPAEKTAEKAPYNRLLAPQASSFRQYAETYDEMMKICEETGRKPYEVLRDALDEWLQLRRAPTGGRFPVPNVQAASNEKSFADLERSIAKLSEQNELLLQYLDRITRRSHEMDREILTACFGAIDLLWRSLVVPALRKKGRTPEQIQTQFEFGRQEWEALCQATLGRIEEAFSGPRKPDALATKPEERRHAETQP
jgi:hypothetical protein